jgi:hypothetical protein
MGTLIQHVDAQALLLGLAHLGHTVKFGIVSRHEFAQAVPLSLVRIEIESLLKCQDVSASETIFMFPWGASLATNSIQVQGCC